nr:histidine utilization repressor [Sphingomonas sp. Y57]
MALAATSAAPLYRQVKEHVLKHVASGEWPMSSRVPSENELVRELGVSRMTVNRALTDLAGEGVLVRIAGVGTFVAGRSAHTHPLQIRNIADEVRGRGHEYHARVIRSEVVTATVELARDFELPRRSKLFHTIIVHHENGAPVQLEDRFVNPSVAPDYLVTDFTRTTPHEYLIQVAPLQRAEHILRAVMPDEESRALLQMPANEPCLLLLRRTWTNEAVASAARLHYPGSRHEFEGRFAP